MLFQFSDFNGQKSLQISSEEVNLSTAIESTQSLNRKLLIQFHINSNLSWALGGLANFPRLFSPYKICIYLF